MKSIVIFENYHNELNTKETKMKKKLILIKKKKQKKNKQKNKQKYFKSPQKPSKNSKSCDY